VKATATGFEMGAPCLVVASLGALQEGGNASQVGSTIVDIKRQRENQCVGGIADLAQCDPWVFPPETARSGGLGTNG
jgi:hypothetical protein